MAMQLVSILLIPHSHQWVQLVERIWNGPGNNDEINAELDRKLQDMPLQEVVRVTLQPGHVLGMRGYTIHAGDVGREGTGSVRVHFYASRGFVSDTTCYVPEFGSRFDSLCQPTTEPKRGSTPKVPAWQGKAGGGDYGPRVPYHPPTRREEDMLWRDAWVKDFPNATAMQRHVEQWEAASEAWEERCRVERQARMELVQAVKAARRAEQKAARALAAADKKEAMAAARKAKADGAEMQAATAATAPVVVAEGEGSEEGGKAKRQAGSALHARAQPSPAQPSPAQPSPAQPSPAQPSPAQPSPAQPSPAQPSPAQPSPAQPSPAQPSPAQPSPAQPSPAQPSPAQPSPAQPSPAQPSPAQPSPAQPSPAQPSPAQPSPAQPSPAQPSPAQPSPAQPSPAQPSPAQPSPAQPSPAQPSPPPPPPPPPFPPPPPPPSPYHKKQAHGAQEQPGAAAMEALPGRYRSGASRV
ncbi:hypothetical protein V8C86DRAFT_2570370 [Haematococcus lacustris]